MVFPELTPVLRSLKSSPANIADDSMDVIERFVVLLYDRTSSLTKVNEARQELFSKKSRNLDNISPTRAALVQHNKRSSCVSRRICMGTDTSKTSSSTKPIRLRLDT